MEIPDRNPTQDQAAADRGMVYTDACFRLRRLKADDARALEAAPPIRPEARTPDFASGQACAILT